MNRSDRIDHLLRCLIGLIPLLAGPWAFAQCPPVTPGFAWANVGDAIAFTNSSQSDFALLTDVQWSFGDGAYDSGDQVTHTYSTADIDTVRLSFLAEGCSFSVQGLVAHGMSGDQCGLSLFSGFSASALGNNQMSFLDASYSPTDMAYLWMFGDGALDLSPSPAHVYVFPGSYDVTHSVASQDVGAQVGCVAGSARRVLVDGNASSCDTSLFVNLDAAYFDGVASFNVVATATDPDLSILSGEWDFGDGTSDVGLSPAPQHFYSYPGPYQTCLTVHAVHVATQEPCEAIVCHTFEVAFTGVAEKGTPAAVRAYPDPFADELHLETNTHGAPLPWCMTDLAGRVVRTGTMPAIGRADMTTSNLPAGLYLLRFGVGGDARSIRLVRR